MEIQAILKGTIEEMENLFEKHYVKHYKKVGARFEVSIRVVDDFNAENIKTIKEMHEALDKSLKDL